MTWQWAVPIAVAIMLGLIAQPLLRALPPPVDEPGGRPYEQLATGVFAATATVLIALAGTTVLALAPRHAFGWAGLGTAGVLAAMIDARTGYLPAPVMRAGWALTIIGALATAGVTADWSTAARAAAGATATTALFWLFHRFGGGFGFGDVRLAPIVGGAAASVSWTLLFGALILGGLLGVAWGLTWRALGRGKAFPYGPALVAGPYLALALVPP
ncbi:prepilin peptidase [Micropruina sp.]|uniref:prepilin peptidase n=1 Tax=Micropruina sp. TaxID=2737536 RepID=UPI0039E5FFF3